MRIAVLCLCFLITPFGCKKNLTNQTKKQSENLNNSNEKISFVWSKYYTIESIGFRKGAKAPKSYSLFQSSNQQIKQQLSKAPNEALVNLKDSKAILQLPQDSLGSLIDFRIVENNTMDSVLASKFPMIKSYSGYQINNQIITLRCEMNDNGFFAMISHPDETYFIEPVTIPNTEGIYIWFKKSDLDNKDRDYPPR